MNHTPLLIDFDGVIRIGNIPAPFASEFLKFLKLKKIPCYFLSNSTLKSGNDLINFLIENNLEHIFPAMTTVDATLQFVNERFTKVAVYCIDKIKSLFQNKLDYSNPQAVIMGDMGNIWNFEILNSIFNYVKNGAELIAMHKNKYWLPDGVNLQLDAGAFVEAIEYATGKEAILIGKPSPLYFQSALTKIGFPTEHKFFMIGDDIEADINAAQNIGATGILILTGKTKKSNLKDYNHKPDFVAENLNEVTTILGNFYS